MSSKGGSSSSRAVLVAAVLVAASAAEAASPVLKLTGFESGVVDRARAGAIQRLEHEACRRVFTDFRDAQGRTLQQNLDDWAGSAADYVGLVPFLDGSRQAGCRKTNTALVASPGVRRVFVCRAFADVQLRQPRIAESMVIHEILHTLGLGEAPQPGQPSSIEITQRVESRCR